MLSHQVWIKFLKIFLRKSPFSTNSCTYNCLSAPQAVFLISLLTVRFKFVNMDSHTIGKNKYNSPKVSSTLKLIRRDNFVPALKI